VHRAILAGDKVTGVTIMQMDAGLDTGDMLLKHQYALAADETSQSLHDILARMGAEAIVETLELLAAGKLTPEKQDDAASTYAKKIAKEEALLDWRESAVHLERKVRAFNPWPIAYTNWQGQHLRIGTARVIQQQTSHTPGAIVHASRDGIDIAAGEDVLRLLSMQLPGGKMISASDFYNAHRDELHAGAMT